MGRFVLPTEWYDTPAPPPPDPMAAREEKIANDTRVESEINRFLAARQDALFHAPDAFYRTEGEDAIHAAPETTRKLDALRRDLIDRAANDYQRGRLGAALGAQMELTRDGMARHVAEQSLAWQRQVAQDRIALLTKEAALHHGDDTLIDTLGHAAATAARAHARVGTGLPAGETEDTAAATARSGVLGAAIQARLDRGDTDGAKALFTKVGDQLDPEHAAPIDEQIAQAEQPAALPDGPYYFDVVPGRGWMEPEEEASPSASGVEPPPGSPEYQAAQAEAEGLERENPPPEPETEAATIALPGIGGPASETVLGRLGNLAARAIPYVGRVASGAAAGATTLLVPSNTQATTIELSAGLRLRTAPGQRSVTIERKVDNGILGTGIGAKWEELPVQAEHATAPDGRSMIAIDPQQLERAIGAEAMGRIARSSGIAMARPPRKEDDGNRPPPGIGHNSGNDPDPGDGQKPPPLVLMPAPTDERPAKITPERDREIEATARAISEGHAYKDHFLPGKDFPDLRTREEFKARIEYVMRNATIEKNLEGGRIGYWYAPTNTIVIENPTTADKGTAFRSSRRYFDRSLR